MSESGRSSTNGGSAATMRQVADRAGVSTAAVSRVLHGRGSNVRVSESTADVIRQAAKELNYTPNALARSLRMNKTNTVGLVFENFGEISAGPLYYVHLLDGVAGEVFRARYRLTILAEMDRGEIRAILGDGRLDGLIWCKMPEDPALLASIVDSPLPCVALNAPPPKSNPGLPYICCDNEGGAALVARHFYDLGHEKVAFVLEEGEENTPDALCRLEGFRVALRDLGIRFGDDDVFMWSRSAAEVIRWERTHDHTAIFAWNERLGGEVLRQCMAAEIPVPDRLSVVGFDSTQYCETTSPRLTAVRQPTREMARMAARTLLDLVAGKTPKSLATRFACALDVRDSSGARNIAL